MRTIREGFFCVKERCIKRNRLLPVHGCQRQRLPFREDAFLSRSVSSAGKAVTPDQACEPFQPLPVLLRGDLNQVVVIRPHHPEPHLRLAGLPVEPFPMPERDDLVFFPMDHKDRAADDYVSALRTLSIRKEAQLGLPGRGCRRKDGSRNPRE